MAKTGKARKSTHAKSKKRPVLSENNSNSQAKRQKITEQAGVRTLVVPCRTGVFQKITNGGTVLTWNPCKGKFA